MSIKQQTPSQTLREHRPTTHHFVAYIYQTASMSFRRGCTVWSLSLAETNKTVTIYKWYKRTEHNVKLLSLLRYPTRPYLTACPALSLEIGPIFVSTATSLHALIHSILHKLYIFAEGAFPKTL